MRKGLTGARSLCAIALVSGVVVRRGGGRTGGRATTCRGGGVARRQAGGVGRRRRQERVERDARERVGGVARPGAAAVDPRHRRQARVLARQHAARVRESARRSRVHRGLRPARRTSSATPIRRSGQTARRRGRPTASSCPSCAATAGRPCRLRRRRRRSVRGSEPPVRTNDTFKVADILQAPISYGPEASGDGRSVAYITREATDPRDLLHALGHAVAPRRQLPRRRRPRALAARRLARRRRDRLRARQLAQQRRRDPQPGLGRRHAASPRLRRRRRAPACRGCSATGWRPRSRRTTRRSSGSTARA